MTTLDELARRAAAELQAEIGGVVDPDSGLEAIRRGGGARVVQLDAQWNRRRWAVGAAAGLVAAAVVLLVVLAARDDESTGPVGPAPVTSTAASTTSVSSSTVVVPTTSVASMTSTVVVPTTVSTGAALGFQPACDERDPASGSPTSWTPWPADATLGPLGAAPSLVIDLPQQRLEGSDQLQPVYADTVEVPGGFLVSVRTDTDASMLTLVDTDGSIRWQRCLDVTPTVAVAPAGRYAVLLQPEYSSVSGEKWTLSTVSLVDGRPGPALDGVLGDRTRFVTTTGSGLLFTHSNPHAVDEATDRLAVLDLVTLTVTDIPYPPGSNGIDAPQLALESNWWTGNLVNRNTIDGQNVVTSVFVDGSWRTDDAARAAEAVGYYFTGDRGDSSGSSGWYLQFRDGTGRVRWERRDIVNWAGEAFASGLAGDVVVARGCQAPSQGSCSDPGTEWSLYGLDASTGTTLWERPGAWDVSVLRDGKAMIHELLDQPGAWSMIDTTTGKLVADDQVWNDPSAFGYECCGGGDFVHTAAQGDVVVASNYGRVSIWYPRDRSVATQHVSVP